MNVFFPLRSGSNAENPVLSLTVLDENFLARPNSTEREEETLTIVNHAWNRTINNSATCHYTI